MGERSARVEVYSRRHQKVFFIHSKESVPIVKANDHPPNLSPNDLPTVCKRMHSLKNMP